MITSLATINLNRSKIYVNKTISYAVYNFKVSLYEQKKYSSVLERYQLKQYSIKRITHFRKCKNCVLIVCFLVTIDERFCLVILVLYNS